MLPGGGFAFHADYAHEGADLVITGADGSKVVVVDYFAGSEPADLMTLDGHHLAGSLVDSLAGPIAPAQYAQAADTQTADVPAAVPEIGQVESIEGTITATGADGVKVDLAAGSSVFQGDVLETSSDGAVNIVFMDGTTFSLGADAKMVLDELIYDASSNTGSSIMSVVTGTFVFITGQVAKLGPDAMKVNTPSGTIGIRGTKVACNLEIADGQSICVLLPEEDGTVGEFIFTNESGSQGVSNAYEAIIANTFNASLIVTQVLPDQLGSLFEGLLPGVLETEAPPVVLGQGGTFFDFLAGRGNAAQGLQTSGVLDDQEGLALLTGGTVPEQDPQSLAVAASLFIAEPAVDGPGTLSTGNLSLVLAQSITLTGFSVTANGSPVALTSGGVPVILTQDGNTVEGFAGGELIFRFTLNPETGDVTVFLAQPLDHLDTSATGTSDTIEFSFEVEVVFIDGSSQTVLVQANVLDAGPTATTTSNAVDEATDIDAPATGNLAIVAGNDGLDSAELTGVTATDGGGIIPLTSGGEAITLTSLGGGTFQGVTSGDTVVFEITFDAATGDYSFTLLEPLDQPSDGADSITLTFDMVVTDGDGDSVTSTIVIDVTDDVVVAADDDGGTVTEGDPAVAGNVITNDDLGSDGLGGITQFVHDGVVYTTESAGGAVQSNDGTTIVIMTALDGIFTFNFETGAYSYVAPDSVDNTGGDPIETFVYTIADGDGDTDTATLTIAVADVNAPTANPDSETLDEAAGDGAGFTNIVKSGSLIDDDDPGLDGFGAVKIAGVTYDGGLGAADKSEDATTITYTGAGWTLVIDKLTGDYTFTQTDAFPHDTVQGTNDAIGTFTYTLQDLDGTTDNSTLTITITDDIIAAFDDDGGAIQEGAAGTLTGSVLDNDDSGVDGFGAVTQFVHGGVVYTPDADGIITITTALGGSFTFDFNTGEYSYTPPPEGTLSADATETFTYTIADGDGDTDTATLTITVDDVIEPAGAFLVTNTNAGLQDLRIIVTSNDAEVVGSGIPSTAGGQEGTVQLGNGGGVLFEETESYAVIVKFEAGSGTTNLTNLDLIFDLEAADLDDPDNVFLTLLDQGNVQLGDQGSSVDGVIWQIEFNEALSEFEASDAILYDIQSDTVLGDVVVFDTDLSNTSFVLDFGLLPTGGNVLLAENALFGDIEVLDISGSNNEVNTLILTAQDVIDVTDGGDRLIVLGDDDTLVLEDGDDWHLESSGVTVAGSDETFNLYMATSGAELLVDDDLTVVFETAMA